MLDAAREAIGFVAGADERSIGTDRKLVLALVKDIEIIGEAAARVSPEARRQLPGVPWEDIVGMRNRLIHAYFDVDVRIVWATVSRDLPPLVAVLEPAVSG